MRIRGVTPSVRHIFTAVIVLGCVLVAGVVGYALIEDMSFTQALYMTVITISGVGFSEVKDLGTGGIYFTIFLIVTGVSAVLFLLATVFEFILGEYLGDVWGRRKMKSSIEKLRGHYVVCGYGRVGRSVAEELSGQGKDLVVIEHDSEPFQDCVDDGYLCVLGSATDNHVLREAGVEFALGLVSALRADADNLYVILTAKVMNPGILLVARADQPGTEEKLEMVGADRVISPHKIAGKRMANLLVRPRVCEFLDVGIAGNLPEYQLTELRVTDDSPMIGKTVKGSGLRERTGVTILAVRKAGEKNFNANPPADTDIEREDLLILIGTPEQMSLMEAES